MLLVLILLQLISIELTIVFWSFYLRWHGASTPSANLSGILRKQIALDYRMWWFFECWKYRIEHEKAEVHYETEEMRTFPKL